MSPLVPLNAPAHATGGDRASLRKAAEGFEAMFIRRMLEAARAADFGDDDGGGTGIDQFAALRDTRLADIAAQRGAFGIAAAIEAQLARQPSGRSGA